MRKFISIKFIIEGLFRDLQLDREPNWADWVEWSAEALEYINAEMQYVIRSTDNCDGPYLEVDCYKATLPNDFYSIIEPVIFNGKALLQRDDMKIYASPVQVSTDALDQGIPITADTYPRIVLNGDSVTGTDYYTIVDGCIITSIKEGTLVINYRAIPLDEDGYPMIPDEYMFVRAIKAYITYRVMYPKWLAGTITDRVYNEVKEQWMHFGQAARNVDRMPSISELESIKRQWVRLIPNNNSFSTGFTNLDRPERRSLH